MNVKSTPKKKVPAKAKLTKATAKKEAPKGPVKTVAEAKKAPRASSSKPRAAAPSPGRPSGPAGPPAAPARTAKRTEKRPVARLGKKDLDLFRKLLLEKQREFTEAYKVSKGDSRSNLDNGTEDYIDYAVSSYAKEFLLSLSEMDRKQLLLVQEALRRIDRGEYGLCLQCGQEIPRKRLEVVPWVRHCVRCQELEEQGLLPQYPYAPEGEEAHDPTLALDDEEYEGPLPREEEAEEEDDMESEDSLVIEGEEE